MHTDDIDRLLADSNPVSDLTGKERRLLATLADQSAPTGRRRYARPIAITAIAATLLAGGGVAAAAANGLWSPWAQNDALITIEYELPSGTECEFRFGNVTGAPEIDAVIRDALAGVEIEDADIVEGATYVGAAGDPLTDDHAYETGIMWAIQLRIEEALVAHDLDDQWSSIDGEGFCS